ncbi:toxin [Streptomyces libani subsp. rufus]|nr:toxin [Streptomyces libani subsp. rufus]
MTSAAAPHTGDDALAWFKSSYSSDEGGDCIEVAYEWRKSSHSASEGGNCVEVATCPHAIHIRDSKSPDGPILTLSAAAWSAFLTDVTK